MKVPRSTLLWTALLLISLGLAHSTWRHWVHQVPLLPGSQAQYWDIEARVELQASGNPVQVRLAIPESQPGFLMQSEHTASPGYGVNFIENGLRHVEWSIRGAEGLQWLYYRTQFRVDDQQLLAAVDQPPAIQEQLWEDPIETAAAQLLRRSWQESAEGFSLAQALTRRLSDTSNENAGLLLSELAPEEALVRLLNEAQVPARVLRGLRLEDGRRNQRLQPLVQVFQDHEWRLYDPVNALEEPGQRYLLWQQASGPVLEVMGAKDSQVNFSMLSTREPASGGVHALAAGDALLNLSIHSLPITEQAVFRTLMLLPVGALVVVLLRVFIGLKTSGTFMPVLIALAFLEMSLLPGVITFF
jgi:hypothetical protein